MKFRWNRKDSYQDIKESIYQTPISHPPGVAPIFFTLLCTCICHPMKFLWNRKDSFQNINKTAFQTPISHPPGGELSVIFPHNSMFVYLSPSEFLLESER